MKTPEELRITPKQHAALHTVLTLFEGGQFALVSIDTSPEPLPKGTRAFNMNAWTAHIHDCGTAHCIGGWAEELGGTEFPLDMFESNYPLYNLFYPNIRGSASRYLGITPESATIALRNYLETGDAQWPLVLDVEADDSPTTLPPL